MILAVVFAVLTSLKYYSDSEMGENDDMLEMVQGLLDVKKDLA